MKSFADLERAAEAEITDMLNPYATAARVASWALAAIQAAWALAMALQGAFLGCLLAIATALILFWLLVRSRPTLVAATPSVNEAA